MKRIIAILLLLVLGWGAQAQGTNFAGPDKEVVREPDNSQTTTLGVPDGSPDVCYIWQGPHIISDPNQPVITVHPTQDVETYNVKRISKNGVEEDQALVTLSDEVVIVSITPKYGCYSDGDAIAASDFDIVTSPAGYENRVTISPATAHNRAMSSTENIPVTFSLTVNDHTDQKIQNILVVNSDLEISEGCSVNALNLAEMLEDGSEFVKKMEDFMDALDGIEFIKIYTPCEWDVNLNFTPPNIQFKKKCCSDHTMNDVLVVSWPSTSVGASFGCRFPFYGIPHVASVDFLLNLGLTLGFGPIQGEISPNTNCCSFCIPASLSFSVGGGVGAAIGGDLLQANLTLQGSATAGCQWCPVGGQPFSCSLNGKVSVVGELSLISIVSYTVECPLFSYTL